MAEPKAKVVHYTDVPAEIFGDTAPGASIRWLIDDDHDGAPVYSMRMIEIEPEGHSPKHTHPYEHEVYVLAGEGVVLDGDVERPMKKDDVIYVAPDELHQFRNTGQSVMTVLCLVPNTAPR